MTEVADVIVGVVMPTDTGASSTDKITSNGNLSPAFISPANFSPPGGFGGWTSEYSINGGATWDAFYLFAAVEGQNSVMARYTDALGTHTQSAEPFVFTYDTTAATAPVITRAGAEFTNQATTAFTVTFAEDVTGVDLSAFTLNIAGTDAAASIASVTGSGKVYTVTVNTGGAQNNGTIGINFSGGAIRDLAGNGGPFLPQTTFSTGTGNIPTNPGGTDPSGVEGVSIADLNGDGKADLVIANSKHDFFNAQDITVRLGNGDGTFGDATNYGIGAVQTVATVIADFNGDGKFDIASVNQSGLTVSMLMGNGDGTFNQPTSYNTGTYPNALATADFNNDGKLDIVTTNFAVGNSISVLLGNGDGTLDSKVDYVAGQQPTTVATADLNEDGAIDIVTTNAVSGDFSVFLGVSNGTGGGTGAFQEQTTFGANLYPDNLTFLDVDGDGDTDAVFAEVQRVGVILGNGNGTFAVTPTYYDVGFGNHDIVAADMNGDGVTDLVVSNSSTDNVSVLYGNANGTFQSQIVVAAGDQPSGLAVSDFNGDGKNDIAVTNFLGNSVSIILSGLTTAQSPFVTLDTIAPAAPTRISLLVDDGVSNSDKFTSNGALVVGGLEADGAAEFSIDNGVTWTSTFTGANGVNTVIARHVDHAGNRSATATSPFTFTLYDIINGTAAANTLTGGSGIERISGLGGNDTLSGMGGNDILIGGAGRDVMTGGAGADVFDFNAVSETGKAANTRDVIKDFKHNAVRSLSDQIDLSGIDATGSAAGHTFKFLAIKGAAFTGVKGQLHWFQLNVSGSTNDKTIIEGDINGDKIADFQIELKGLMGLVAADFVL